MDAWYSAEIEGELLIIGVIAIVAAFVYHKLDKWMQLHEKTNELLENLLEEKGSGTANGSDDKNEG